MQKIIEDLNKFNRCLLGEGYNQALDYINNIIPLEILEIKSGTQVYDWTVPEEWIIRDAWVKFNGEKILDYKENPLCLTVGSLPIHKKIDRDEFRKHLTISDEQPDAYSYDYKFYDKDWGFTMPKSKVELDVQYQDEIKKSSILEEGEYEVFIDSEYKPGIMKIGVHTIKGESDREILLFAHLDHPYQANDNLSAVAGLISMVDKLKAFKHTIKLVFCPETIGSIAYTKLADISKVDFVVALECIGNDNTLLYQTSYNKEDRINKITRLALQSLGESYRGSMFRMNLGSDEYIFNDPMIGIPGILLSRFPYKEYHTSEDTPDKIKEDMIKKVQEVVLKIIKIYEEDFIPTRKFKAPLMRSKYGIQTGHKLMNLDLDYLWYDIDGKKYLSEIIFSMGISWDYVSEVITKIKEALKNEHSSIDTSKKSVKKTTK